MSRSDIKKVIDAWSEWLGDCHIHQIRRQLELNLSGHLARTFIGVRRCGKSYAAASLLEKDSKKSLYINFEDPFFIQKNSVDVLDEIISVFTEYHQKTPEVLLFDEIHNINGWERWVRKMVDLKKFKIMVTGSSAKMLSSELATALTGRSLAKTIWPLSFGEFLLFQKITCRNEDEYVGALRRFLQWGGFPEIALTNEENQKTALLRQYLTDILYKDIIKRYEIRTSRNLEQLVRYYLTNTSSLHSYNSIRKAFGLNVETVKEYTSHLQEAFLIFEVNRFHPNLKVQARDAKKVYCVDTGLRNANASTQNEDFGKLAENAAYIHLRRQGQDVTYFKENGEVDFLVTEFGKPKQAIQVCYDDLENAETGGREIESLIEGLAATHLAEGQILTRTREEKIRKGGKVIELTPLYKWLLR